MLKYHVEFRVGGFEPNEIRAEGAGGADAVVIVSIVRNGKPPHNGPVSFAILSADSVGYDGGDVAEIPDTELFQAMTAMAGRLSESATVLQWQRDLSGALVEAARERVVGLLVAAE